MTICKQVHARVGFRMLRDQANARIDARGLPSSIAELQETVASALQDAHVGRGLQREILGVMLALETALGRAPPLPARELQRARSDFRRAANVMRNLPRELDQEIHSIEEVPSNTADPVFELVAPLGEARIAVAAAARAAAEGRPRPKYLGRPIPPSSCAIDELVALVRGSRPEINLRSLTELVTRTIGAVIIGVNDGRRKKVPTPSWRDRVRAAVENEPIEPYSVERRGSPSPFERDI